MDIKQMADMLVANEECLMGLYGRYAKMFPEKNHLWMTLENAEKGHAELVRLLFKDRHVNLTFNEENFDPDTVMEIRRNVEKYTAENLKKNTSYAAALQFALYMERFLREKELIHYFHTDDKDVKKTFEYLDRSTQKHIELILAEIGKEENE
jgi:rubrerythrin